MKVLLDECVPRKFRIHLGAFECSTVPEAGLAGKKNGELLAQAEQLGFQALVTLDQGIIYQQSLKGRAIAIVIIGARSSRLPDLLPKVPLTIKTLSAIQPGELVHI